jgi:hypothetical protein
MEACAGMEALLLDMAMTMEYVLEYPRNNIPTPKLAPALHI